MTSKKVFVMTDRAEVEYFCRNAIAGQGGLQVFASLGKMVQVSSLIPEERIGLFVVDTVSLNGGRDFLKWFSTFKAEVKKRFCFITDCFARNPFEDYIQQKTVPIITFPCSKEDFKKKLLCNTIKKVDSSVSNFKVKKTPLKDFTGSSVEIMRVKNKALLLADTERTILIRGATGTGKTFLAELIHASSNRSSKPYVYVNIANLEAETCDAELFGSVSGAFTGAVNKSGLVEEARGGTLVLDEIAEAPLAVQAKLLDFIQTKRFRKKGSTKEICVDVRLIFATNANLEDCILQKTFRKDLFYRICENTIVIPELREHAEDIPLLVRSILDRHGYKNLSVEDSTFALLALAAWPGNVRELENKVLSAALVAEAEGSDSILPEHFD